MRRSLKFRSGFLRHAGLLLGVVVLVAGVGVLVWQLVWLRALATADQTASVAATVLAIVVAGLALVRWWRGSSPESRTPIAPAKPPRRVELARPVERAEPVPADEPLPDLPAVGADKSTSAIALGVHSSIPLMNEGSGDLDAALPTFVPRDQGVEVAAWLRSAAATGGVLVLVGDSSVGKTRLLYETALAELPAFRVAAPDPGDGQLADRLARSAWQRPGLIVWLDEMHRFLSGPYCSTGTGVITAMLIRRLLDLPTPVVVLGSLWPEHLRTLMSTEIESETGVARLRYPDAASILGHGRCRKLVLTGFSTEERRQAQELADRDPRLDEALSDQNFNVTEALAGAPRLVERFDHATEHERAILLAAVDARRLGILAPLRERLLRTAAGGHYTGAHPSDTEIQRLLHELTSLDRPLDRAAAPLLPIHDPRDRTIVGYTVADYLLQSLTRRRRRLPIPDGAWESYLGHTTDPADIARLADSADRRGLYRYAIPLYRRAMAFGIGGVAPRLASLLAAQGSTTEAVNVLETTTKPGDLPASFRQALAKARRGDNTGAMTALKGGLMSGDTTAAVVAADIRDSLALASAGDIDELRSRAEAGDRLAAWTVADLLRDEGRPDEAIAVLQPYADAGDAISARQLTALGGSAELDGLHTDAESGNHEAAVRLAARLHAAGRTDEAIAVLRSHADAGDLTSARRLARLLAQQTDLDDLRTLAEAGDHAAAWTLADLLHAGGETIEAMAVLRAHAEAGDPVAATTLAELMHASGDTSKAIAMLRRHADDAVAAGTLADLLYADRETYEARRVLRSHAGLGDAWAADRMDELLDQSGDRRRRSKADARDRLAAWTLAGRLHAAGKTNEAISTVRFSGDVPYSVAESTLTGLLDTAARINNDGVPPHRGDNVAAWTLADRLHVAGRADDAIALLRPRADAGDRLAAWTLADLLYAMGRTGDATAVLRSRADVGDMTAARRLAEILAQERDVDSLRSRADAGDQACAMRLASILAKRQDLDGLREELFAGNTGHAAVAMRTLLQARAEVRPDQLWFGFNTDGSPATTPA